RCPRLGRDGSTRCTPLSRQKAAPGGLASMAAWIESPGTIEIAPRGQGEEACAFEIGNIVSRVDSSSNSSAEWATANLRLSRRVIATVSASQSRPFLEDGWCPTKPPSDLQSRYRPARAAIERQFRNRGREQSLAKRTACIVRSHRNQAIDATVHRSPGQ